MTKTRIGVVRGGPSDEYDVSLRTGAAVLNSLDKEKYEPLDIVISKDGVWYLHGLEIEPHEVVRRVDVIFNALHGYYGEDGKIQSLLEAHRMPFTGSGSLSSAIAMNKILAKEYFRRAGLKTPAHILIDKEKVEEDFGKGEDPAMSAYMRAHSKFSLSYIIKPVSAGSSIGISLVKGREDFTLALTKAFEFGDSVMVEEYIPGIEATVGVIESFRGKSLYALPPVEIRPGNRTFFDYEAKYGEKVESRKYRVESQEEIEIENGNREDDNSEGEVPDTSFGELLGEPSGRVLGMGNRGIARRKNVSGAEAVGGAVQELVPATFSTSIKKELEKLAIAAHSTLGLRHYSRSDFIISPRRGIFIIETNSLPGLTEESIVPKVLTAIGSSLSEFVDHLVMLALSR
jgi:D-alanine-D-alanine ligase